MLKNEQIVYSELLNLQKPQKSIYLKGNVPFKVPVKYKTFGLNEGKQLIPRLLGFQICFQSAVCINTYTTYIKANNQILSLPNRMCSG